MPSGWPVFTPIHKQTSLPSSLGFKAQQTLSKSNLALELPGPSKSSDPAWKVLRLFQLWQSLKLTQFRMQLWVSSKTSTLRWQRSSSMTLLRISTFWHQYLRLCVRRQTAILALKSLETMVLFPDQFPATIRACVGTLATLLTSEDLLSASKELLHIFLYHATMLTSSTRSSRFWAVTTLKNQYRQIYWLARATREVSANTPTLKMKCFIIL